ncbi:MAG TPA: hypothetical protein PLC28_07470 [Spirochaetota bacterium]|nr:hypothetical protein [Spirochaetota bacterium]HPC40835.1 hypothetical protein [Spirochaetota bacterium]HPL18933.1 hypothetical protein [Spirochaetota bacterium]HQJ70665.1 hypothetical protein [Spirochaetota bacterium]HRS77980.1 hypothetical protein [Spirochaetota bacterium]
MKKKNVLRTLLLCLLATAGILTSGEPAENLNITGPYTHKNISIYLVHGKNAIDADKFLTLEEAMDAKKATVHETENVNQLTITNSSNFNIFIMSGDIVKGGKQDRVIQYNYIVPPGSKRMPVQSFCVESGRWEKRGSENQERFSSSREMIASKDLKMSVKKDKSQSQVWSKVAEMQGNLEKNLGAPVKGESASSLQLTLEHGKVKEAQQEYARALDNIMKDQKDVIGYSCVINGKINSAEVFASNVLFKKLWPKLLKSSIVEAVAASGAGGTYKAKTADEVKKFINDSEKAGTVAARDVNRRTKIVEKEAEDRLYYETRDADNKGQWINKSYLMK